MPTDKQRLIFDEVAEIYDQVRPQYPQQLALDLQSFTNITSESKLLEIGCGTGQATQLFAPLNCSILCLEPGKNLAKIAQNNCAPFGKVEINNTTFENWPLKSETFHLIFSAQAFHWIKAEIRFSKAVQALKPNGVLAIFGNRPQKDESELDQSIQKIYTRIAPNLKSHLSAKGHSSKEPPWEDQFDESEQFSTVFMSRYVWERAYKTEEYIKLMETQSDHRMLPNQQREDLLQALGQSIEEFGGIYKVHYITRAYFARLKRVDAI